MVITMFQGQGQALTPIVQTVGKEKNRSICRKHPVVTTTSDGKKITVDVPDVSGNTIRHDLRTFLVAYIIERFTGQKIDLNTLVILSQGGSGIVGETTKKELYEKLKKIEAHKKTNVILNLFGGALGGVMTEGRSCVHDMVPVCIDTIRSGILPGEYNPTEYENLWAGRLQTDFQYVRGALFKQDPSLLELLDEEGFSRLLENEQGAAQARAKRKAKKQQADTQDNSGEAPLAEASLNNNKDSKTQSMQMIYSAEAIVSGTVLDHRMLFRNVTDVEIGAIVAALKGFSEYPYICGMSSKGMGQISLNYNVSRRENGVIDPSYGTVSIDGFGGFEITGHLPARLDNFNTYINNVTLDQVSAGRL